MQNGCSNLREFGKFRLDAQKRVLWHDTHLVNLSLKEIELLCVLTENRGEVVTKGELLEKVWRDAFVEESNLSRHIYILRKTFKDLGEDRILIQTVPRRGYRFAGDVREIDSGGIVIEKHTRTQTVIEIQEEKKEEKKSPFARFLTPAAIVILLFVLVGSTAFLGYQNLRSETSRPEIKSIAVLPFKTIDKGYENTHQALGLADVLITRLSNIKQNNVRPTSSILSFENGEQDSIEAGRQLNVDAVLEGTIYRANDKVRITTRLIKVSDGSTIWSGQFEKFLQEELRLQDEIALQVAGAMALNLSGSEKEALTKLYTENRDAYELYLKGRYEWNKRSWAAAIEAERLFRNAIEKDPNFSLAYIGLADTLVMNTASTDQAFRAVEKALEHDPNLAEAYATLGFLKIFHLWEWQKAESDLKRSIELNPGYATAHHWYAQLLAIQGRYEEAKSEMRRALEINPVSHNLLADLGQIYYFNREYQQAEAYCRKALEIYPDFQFAHEYLFDIYLKTGEYDKAVESKIAADKIQGTFANEPVERQKQIEALLDSRRKIYRRDGIKKFMQIDSGETQDGNVCYVFATSYAVIGEKEKALACLEKAFESRSFLSAFVKADPVFDDIRSEPRYQEILRKMNLR